MTAVVRKPITVRDAGCNGNLKAFVQVNGVYRPLELVYEQVTFINERTPPQADGVSVC